MSDGEIGARSPLNRELRDLAVQVGKMETKLETKLDAFLNQHIETKAQIASNRLEQNEMNKAISVRIDGLEHDLLNYKSRLDQYRGALIFIGVSMPIMVPIALFFWSRL